MLIVHICANEEALFRTNVDRGGAWSCVKDRVPLLKSRLPARLSPSAESAKAAGLIRTRKAALEEVFGMTGDKQGKFSKLTSVASVSF